MENPAILLRRLNPYCARAMEGAASLCQTRTHADIGARNVDSLLNRQILPVQGQQLLARMVAKQSSSIPTLYWRKDEGDRLEFAYD